MQFTTLTVLLAAGTTALAATCKGVSVTALAGTSCPASSPSGVYYEKEADCGSAATVLYEDARGGSNAVPSSLAIENTSGRALKVYWEEINYNSVIDFYVDLAAGASCEKTLNSGLSVGAISYV